MAATLTFADPSDLARVLTALHRAAEAEDGDRPYLSARWRAIADSIEDAADVVPALDAATGCCPAGADAAALEAALVEARRARTQLLLLAAATSAVAHRGAPVSVELA